MGTQDSVKYVKNYCIKCVQECVPLSSLLWSDADTPFSFPPVVFHRLTLKCTNIFIDFHLEMSVLYHCKSREITF